MSQQYLDRRQAQQSYRPKGGLMSPGLQRARGPFRFRNALTGLGLGIFAFAIYSYSISAVKQDVFDDIDEEAKALARTGTPSGVASLPSERSSANTKPPPVVLTKDEEKRIMESAIDAATRAHTELEGVVVPPQVPAAPSPSTQPRGVLQKLDHKFPWLLDPQNKTLVWGAPPIDDIDKTSSNRT